MIPPLAVSVEYRLVTDRQTDSQTHDYCIKRRSALAWRRAVYNNDKELRRPISTEDPVRVQVHKGSPYSLIPYGIREPVV